MSANPPSITNETLAQVLAGSAPVGVLAKLDVWHGRFAPATLRNEGGGLAMYRKCLRCAGQALEGSLSAHARWCDKQLHAALTLQAFDDLAHKDRRAAAERTSEVRRAARGAL